MSSVTEMQHEQWSEKHSEIIHFIIDTWAVPAVTVMREHSFFWKNPNPQTLKIPLPAGAKSAVCLTFIIFVCRWIWAPLQLRTAAMLA